MLVLGAMHSRRTIEYLAYLHEGVAVWGCLPGSPSARAGLRVGDIVLSVNGVRTRTAAEYFAARAWTQAGMTVRIVREGVEQDLIVAEPTGSLPSLEAVASHAVETRAFAPPEGAPLPSSRELS